MHIYQFKDENCEWILISLFSTISLFNFSINHFQFQNQNANFKSNLYFFNLKFIFL